jgi:hypothetical protein
VLSMSMARSDLRYAMRQVGKANEEDRAEFGYLLRVLLGHLFDATRALKLWRQNSEARSCGGYPSAVWKR